MWSGSRDDKINEENDEMDMGVPYGVEEEVDEDEDEDEYDDEDDEASYEDGERITYGLPKE